MPVRPGAFSNPLCRWNFDRLPTRLRDDQVLVDFARITDCRSDKGKLERIATILRSEGYLILLTQNRPVYTRRSDVSPPAGGQRRRWVTMRELRSMLRPHFNTSRAFTIQPSGNRGFLRIVNSGRSNRSLAKILSQELLVRFKERCGLGQTLIVDAQKRRNALRDFGLAPVVPTKTRFLELAGTNPEWQAAGSQVRERLLELEKMPALPGSLQLSVYVPKERRLLSLASILPTAGLKTRSDPLLRTRSDTPWAFTATAIVRVILCLAPFRRS
jgi:hypothetical protein